MHYVLLTKTDWDEPPRLRHQVAQLLADAGHVVWFFERPVPFWRSAPAPRTVHERITLLGCRELLHHKLRLTPLLHRLNARVALRSLQAGLRAADIDGPFTIVNFNYEYYFAGDVVPGSRVLTVINDDHVARALFGWRAPLEWALERTCRASDRVLAVSATLVERLRTICEPALFRPWADREYRAPAAGPRDTLLYWGYVNHRVDFGLIERLADALPAKRILIVGPQEGLDSRTLRRLGDKQNIEIRPTAGLDDLPLQRVLAGLLPYRSDIPTVAVADLPNKSLRLLARGLPLLIAGMPHFVRHPFVYRLDDQRPLAEVVADAEREFWSVQSAIGTFVSYHSANARLRQFMEICSE